MAMKIDPRRLGSRLTYPAAMVVLFLGGIGLSAAVDVELAVTRKAQDRDSLYAPSFQRVNGPQLEMVYLGSSACGWSNQAPLPDAVETIKRRLAAYARENGMSFRAVGVALDWSAERGLEHLAQFGRFDEISAGYNWGNSLALRYLWSDGAVPRGTPQVVVYRRYVEAPTDSTSVLHYRERGRERLAVRAGLRAILDWAAEGVALPPLKEVMAGIE